MRTNTNTQAVHNVSAIFFLEDVPSRSLLEAVEKAIRCFAIIAPWTDGGVTVRENIQITQGESDRKYLIALEPEKELRTGQLGAYKKRLGLILKALDIVISSGWGSGWAGPNECFAKMLTWEVIRKAT